MGHLISDRNASIEPYFLMERRGHVLCILGTLAWHRPTGKGLVPPFRHGTNGSAKNRLSRDNTTRVDSEDQDLPASDESIYLS